MVVRSIGAWERNIAQMIAEKSLLPPKHFGCLPYAANQSLDFTNHRHEDTYIVLLN